MMSFLNDFGWTEIMHSVRNHQVCCMEHILQLLQSSDSEQLVTEHGVDVLCLSVSSGCLNMVKLVLSYNSNMESKSPINPLGVASFYGYCDIISYLHQFNPMLINMTTPYSGLTCLMFAVVNNHADAVELLLSLGANPYAKNSNQVTALDMTTNKQIKDIFLTKTKLSVSEPKWSHIRNSPMKIKKPVLNKIERKHKCSLTLSPYSPKRLNFLSPRKLKEKTLKTKTLLWEKLKKRKNHGKLECLLKEMDLSTYHNLFLEQEIDTNTLFTLTEYDLTELGVQNDAEIRDIMDKISKYSNKSNL
uniref:Death-associated protein kinase 1 n=1 Tax=Cacopsylla melanoneura TaxID=428564 RepID=A0A8D8WM30_9HEMI